MIEIYFSIGHYEAPYILISIALELQIAYKRKMNDDLTLHSQLTQSILLKGYPKRER